MVSSFDFEKLHSLLEDFYILTQIRITVFNEQFTELISYPDQLAPFCKIIRATDMGRKQCKNCDITACQRAAKQRTLYTYRCHAGLTEAITPLYVDHILIGYLLFGHVFSYDTHAEGWQIISSKCENYGIDMETLKKECLSMPIHSPSYITSASHILKAVATYLCLERMAYLREQALPVLIDQYIQDHFTEDLTAITIAQEFKIGKTQLYEIAQHSYGTGIAKYIQELRITKAKRLLSETDLSLAEVSFQCGFKDYNYFITVFKRLTGTTPKQYQHAKKS